MVESFPCLETANYAINSARTPFFPTEGFLSQGDPMVQPSIMISGHPGVVRACRRALRGNVMSSAVSAVNVHDKADLALLVAKHRPRVLLLGSGDFADAQYALLDLLRRVSPKTKIILIGENDIQKNLVDALAHGVVGYIQLQQLSGQLGKAINRVAAGEAWLPRQVTAVLAKRLMHLSA